MTSKYHCDGLRDAQGNHIALCGARYKPFMLLVSENEFAPRLTSSRCGKCSQAFAKRKREGKVPLYIELERA